MRIKKEIANRSLHLWIVTKTIFEWHLQAVIKEITTIKEDKYSYVVVFL
jgi:hypothetical protein